jgi:hypothetical protein
MDVARLSHGRLLSPVIEAQACGTPVIVTDFRFSGSCGAYWQVTFQDEYDPAHQSNYALPIIANPISRLVRRHESPRQSTTTGSGARSGHRTRADGLGVLDALEPHTRRHALKEAISS